MTTLKEKIVASNGGAHGGVIGIVSFADEGNAFDSFGPEVRRALQEAPIKVLAAAILKECQQANIDPTNPFVDHHIAGNILRGTLRVLLVDRSEEDAKLGMRPMVARRTRRA